MSTQRHILINKPVGMTPLEAIRVLQNSYPEYKHKKIGYAGRLDPMASGLLVLLLDEENLKRKEYEKLPKKYECQMLFGIQTDSYDVLGLIKDSHLPYSLSQQQLEELVPDFIGTYLQPYPPYSSPRVDGHPLFWWARENRLDEIVIPQKEITVRSITIQNWKEVALGALKDDMLKRIRTVKGEFRQGSIIAAWENIFDRECNQQVVVATLEVECSSGTYIRSIAHELGKRTGYGALAYSITRTSIGDYSLDQAKELL